MELLAATIPDTPPPAPLDAPTTQTPESRKWLLAELDQLLAHNDTAVLALLQNHASELSNELGAAYAAVAQHVQAFEFESARAVLLRR